MGLPKRRPAVHPKDAAILDRVKRAKSSEPKWDADGVYAELAAEKAQEWGVPFHEVYEEFSERSAIRRYLGEFSIDEAERLAWLDTAERFASRR